MFAVIGSAAEAGRLHPVERAGAMALKKVAIPVADVADGDQSGRRDRAEEKLQGAGGLSAREAQIAWLVSCGCPDKEICQRLGLERATVRFHLSNAFRKMRAGNRVALAARVHALVKDSQDV